MKKYKLGQEVLVEIQNHYGQPICVSGKIVDDNGDQAVEVKGQETESWKDEDGDIVESDYSGWDGGLYGLHYILD